MSESNHSPELRQQQLAQYPGLQEGAGINGLQAARVVEAANRINTAQDIMARHPNADPAILRHEIDDAYVHVDRFLGRAAARNLALRPSEPEPSQSTPSQPRRRSHRPRQVVNDDGRIVPYGQMTRSANGSRHPQAGRIVY